MQFLAAAGTDHTVTLLHHIHTYAGLAILPAAALLIVAVAAGSRRRPA
jgi:hypothetical protein